MTERYVLPLKRYLYTSFLFALEINIFVLLLRFCSTRLLLIKVCIKSLCLLATKAGVLFCGGDVGEARRRVFELLCFRVCMQP